MQAESQEGKNHPTDTRVPYRYSQFFEGCETLEYALRQGGEGAAVQVAEVGGAGGTRRAEGAHTETAR